MMIIINNHNIINKIININNKIHHHLHLNNNHNNNNINLHNIIHNHHLKEEIDNLIDNKNKLNKNNQ